MAPVLAFDDDADALALVNDTPYGLVNSVLSGSIERGLFVRRGASAREWCT